MQAKPNTHNLSVYRKNVLLGHLKEPPGPINALYVFASISSLADHVPNPSMAVLVLNDCQKDKLGHRIMPWIANKKSSLIARPIM